MMNTSIPKVARFILVPLFFVFISVSTAFAYWGAPEECDPFGEQGREVGLLMQTATMEHDSAAYLDTDISEIQAFVQSSYPLSECWRSYIRFNLIQFTATDLFVDASTKPNNTDFEAYGYGFTAGFQGTFWFYRDWSVGAFAQASLYADMEDDVSTVGLTEFGFTEEDDEITISSRWDVAGGVQFEKLINFGRIYSGFVLQYAQMSIENKKVMTTSLFGKLGPETSTESFTSALDASLFIGGVWEVSSGIFLTAEAQGGARSSIGITISYLSF